MRRKKREDLEAVINYLKRRVAFLEDNYRELIDKLEKLGEAEK